MFLVTLQKGKDAELMSVHLQDSNNSVMTGVDHGTHDFMGDHVCIIS